MKRKFILILAVMMFCSGLYVAAKGLQSKTISENQIVADNSTAQSSETQKNIQDNSKTGDVQTPKEQKKDSDTKVSSQPKDTQKPQEDSKEAVNFKVIDTVGGKVILTTSFDLENKTVAQVTSAVLDSKGIAYRAQGIGDTYYISSISGLAERKAGPESGWCYYVNGVKHSIGAGSYKLKKGDILEWKYLKDGVSK